MRSWAQYISGLLASRKNSTNSSFAKAGLFMLWAFLFLPHLRFCDSLDANRHRHLKSDHDQQPFIKLDPRKLLTVAQLKVSVSGSSSAATAPSPLLPPEKSQFMNVVNGDRYEVVYDDDKRRVHTGPNPLHN